MSSVALSLQNKSELGIFKEKSEDLSFGEKQINDLREVNQNLKNPLTDAVLNAAEDFMPDSSEEGQVYFLVFKTGDAQCNFYQSWRISRLSMIDHSKGVKIQNHIRSFENRSGSDTQEPKLKSLYWVQIDFSSCLGKSVAEVRSEFPAEMIVSNEAIVAAKYLNEKNSHNILIPGYQIKRSRSFNGNGWDLVPSITFEGKRGKIHFGKRDENFKSPGYTVPIISNQSEKIEICF